jgi:hypothetical protein
MLPRIPSSGPAAAAGQRAVLKPHAVAACHAGRRVAAEGPRAAVLEAHDHVVALGFLDRLFDVVAGIGAADRAEHRGDVARGAAAPLVADHATDHAAGDGATAAALGFDRNFAHRLDDAAFAADRGRRRRDGSRRGMLRRWWRTDTAVPVLDTTVCHAATRNGGARGVPSDGLRHGLGFSCGRVTVCWIEIGGGRGGAVVTAATGRIFVACVAGSGQPAGK